MPSVLSCYFLSGGTTSAHEMHLTTMECGYLIEKAVRCGFLDCAGDFSTFVALGLAPRSTGGEAQGGPSDGETPLLSGTTGNCQIGEKA